MGRGTRPKAKAPRRHKRDISSGKGPVELVVCGHECRQWAFSGFPHHGPLCCLSFPLPKLCRPAKLLPERNLAGPERPSLGARGFDLGRLSTRWGCSRQEETLPPSFWKVRMGHATIMAWQSAALPSLLFHSQASGVNSVGSLWCRKPTCWPRSESVFLRML
jgi:hypothetical protein